MENEKLDKNFFKDFRGPLWAWVIAAVSILVSWLIIQDRLLSPSSSVLGSDQAQTNNLTTEQEQSQNEPKISIVERLRQIDSKVIYIAHDHEDYSSILRGVFALDPNTGKSEQLLDSSRRFINFQEGYVISVDEAGRILNLDTSTGEEPQVAIPPLKDEGSLFQELRTSGYAVSLDDWTLLTISTYDENDEPSAFDGSRPLVDQDEYMYNLKDHSIAEPRDYWNALADDDNSGSLIGFDYPNRQYFFQMNGEGFGYGSVLAIDFKTGKKQKLVDVSRSDPTIYSAFTLSPTLEKAFYVYKDKGTYTGRMVYLEDINTVQASVDLTTFFDQQKFRGLYSMRWTDNENSVVLGFQDRMIIVDLQDATSYKVFTDNTSGSGSTLPWDANFYDATPDNLVAFVDSYPVNPECNSVNRGKNGCPLYSWENTRSKIGIYDRTRNEIWYSPEDEGEIRILGWNEPDKNKLPDYKNSSFHKDDTWGWYGTLTVTGYIDIVNRRCGFTEEACFVEYAFFVVEDTDEDAIYDFLPSQNGNAYAGTGKIGLGCYEKDQQKIHSGNDGNDEYYENVIEGEDFSKLMPSSQENPVRLKLTKPIYTSGRGAPDCYSHFRYFEVQ